MSDTFNLTIADWRIPHTHSVTVAYRRCAKEVRLATHGDQGPLASGSTGAGFCLRVIALLTLIWAMPVSAQVLTDVTVDLNGASVDKILPFDVPFRLVGTVAANVQEIEVHYLEFDDRTTLGKEDAVWATAPVARWERVDGLDSTSFEIHMPALDPEAYYAFRFTLVYGPTIAQRDEFRKGARNAIINIVAGLSNKDLTDPETTDLKDRLGKKFLDQLKAMAIVDATMVPGSLFHPSSTGTDFYNRFVTDLGPLRSAQAGIGTSLIDYGPRVTDLQRELGNISTDGTLNKFLTALNTKATRDRKLATLLKQNAHLLALIDLSTVDVERLAKGQPASPAEAVELVMVEDPAVAMQYYVRLTETHDRTVRLKEFIQTFTDPGGRNAAYMGQLVADRLLAPGEDATLAGIVNAPTANFFNNASVAAAQAASSAGALSTQLSRRANAAIAIAKEVEFEWRRLLLVGTSTVQTHETRQKNYLSADAGVMWAPGLDRVVPYLGTNIYFRPVNKDAPLGSGKNLGDEFLRRFAVVIGLTARGVDDVSVGRENLFGTQAGILGVGVRLAQHIRFGGGAVLFITKDPDPFKATKSMAWSYYGSVSFDADVANSNLFKWISN
jgi:hypothetical protein